MNKNILALALLLLLAACGRPTVTQDDFQQFVDQTMQPDQEGCYAQAFESLRAYIKKHPETLYLPVEHPCIEILTSPKGHLRVYNVHAESAMRCRIFFVLTQWSERRRVVCRALDWNGGNHVTEIIPLDEQERTFGLVVPHAPTRTGRNQFVSIRDLNGRPLVKNHGWSTGLYASDGRVLFSKMEEFERRGTMYDPETQSIYLPTLVQMGGGNLVTEGIRRYQWDGRQFQAKERLPVAVFENDEHHFHIEINSDWTYSLHLWEKDDDHSTPVKSLHHGHKTLHTLEGLAIPYPEADPCYTDCDYICYHFDDDSTHYEIICRHHDTLPHTELIITRRNGHKTHHILNFIQPQYEH